VAWYADDSPCDYFGEDAATVLRAVGWLERGRPFSSGESSQDVYERLKRLAVDCWQPAVIAGPHGCDLCRFEPTASGVKNLFVPANGFLYVCPEPIVHYMNAHGYNPPSHFCQCVLDCPPMNSMAYRKAILANGGRVLIRERGP
jgi:hypothetical protein